MQAQSGRLGTLPSTSRDLRQHTRALFSIPLSIRMLTPGGVRVTRGVSLDISEGGLGALVQSDLSPGDVIEVDLKLPGHELTAIAVVRYRSPLRSGFEFLGLTREERREVAQLVEKANEGSRVGSA